MFTGINKFKTRGPRNKEDRRNHIYLSFEFGNIVWELFAQISHKILSLLDKPVSVVEVKDYFQKQRKRCCESVSESE